MAERVCVDASCTLMLVLPNEMRSKARRLWQHWCENGVECIAPPLYAAEVTSVLRSQVYFGYLTQEEGDGLLSLCIGMGVRCVDPHSLQSLAWSLAGQYNRSRAYDAQYMAVARAVSCEMWTGDKKLVNAVKQPWLHWVGE